MVITTPAAQVVHNSVKYQDTIPKKARNFGYVVHIY
jgi:hypothetical protein